jgi:hypothetical protein
MVRNIVPVPGQNVELARSLRQGFSNGKSEREFAPLAKDESQHSVGRKS